MPIYNRYQFFVENGKNVSVPFIELTNKTSDKQLVYKIGRDRMDKLSDKYYGNPYHGWLIMMANPQFGGLEFNIPDETIITIPFPFQASIEDYFNKVREIQSL